MTVPDTTPYPWPWTGAVDAEHLALVVTGWDDHWHAAVGGSAGVLDNIAALAGRVATTITVGHRPGPRWPGAIGAALARPEGLGDHVTAEGVDGFYGSPLDSILRRHDTSQLLVAGLGLETTVHSTMRTANDMGLECLLVVDACASLDVDLVPRAVSMIEMSGGIFGAVGTTDAVLAVLPPSTPSPPEPPP